MKLTGRYGMRSDRKAVWDALQDPAVLVNTLPGVQRLEVAGPNRYSVTMDAGVGAIKGIYQAEFWAEELVEPQSCVLKGSASSSVGGVEFEAAVSLGLAEPAGTILEYEAEARLTGRVAGVGQRLIAAVAKRTAEQFLAAVDDAIENVPGTARAGIVSSEREAGPELAGAPAGTGVGAVFTRSIPPRGGDPLRALVVGLVAGAVIAIAGVLVGRRIGRPGVIRPAASPRRRNDSVARP